MVRRKALNQPQSKFHSVLRGELDKTAAHLEPVLMPGKQVRGRRA
jgi:hypothetical protein